jgi:tetratricopeptide (TPR) repeat protein
MTQEAIAILETGLGAEHPAMAVLYDRLASALSNAADFSASADAYARCIAITRAQPPQVRDDISIAVWHRYLAFALMHAGRITEAEAAARTAIILLTEQFGSTHYIVGHATCVLAWARCEQGHLEEALDLARQGRALMAATDATPLDQSKFADCMLGLCLQRAGHDHEAAALLEPVLLTMVEWQWYDLRVKPFVDTLAAAASAIGKPEPPVIAAYHHHLATLNAPPPD